VCRYGAAWHMRGAIARHSLDAEAEMAAHEAGPPVRVDSP
jgi:hypothetical protein